MASVTAGSIRRELAESTKVALVQDWFFAPGGAEAVAAELLRVVPSADVFTTFADRMTARELGPRLHTWPLQRLLGPTRRYRSLLPLYPLWFDRLDLQRYELVVSSSSGFAKAVRTRPGALHVSYTHYPNRYAWESDRYLAESGLPGPAKAVARAFAPWLRRWDRRTSRRPDVLIASSTAVQQRIEELWDRPSQVIHPPVAVDHIPATGEDDGYLLVVSRVVAHRRLDLLVDAARSLDRPVVVVGDGPELADLQRRAGATVRFTGRIPRAETIRFMQRAHAYVVPGEEAFGIAPVEAMAAGKPVVAFRAGGSLDTVIDGVTGVFFDEATPAALADAAGRLDALHLDAEALRTHAEQFSSEVFRARFAALLGSLGVSSALYDAGG